eukprot:TRINITY_DN111845_c0_g1_i1.p1 TRINITY_DN111845_c0_g1~~TRINITY_DN111845_c0_g1_i1.p1  ORF type:complete len:315 (-),score=89.49 TRINITY_DN111845_c0_g1_i1:143-1021(-)
MSQEHRPRTLFGAAAALYMFSLVETSPSFVAPLTGSDVTRGPSLRGASDAPKANSAPLFSRGSCQVASSFLALSACALAARCRGKKEQRSTRTQMFSEGGQAIVCYSNALNDAAVNKEESRAVTMDVMKVKDMLEEEEFRDELRLFVNTPFITDNAKAAGLIKMMAPLESSVFPKYVTFLAKKKRLGMLKDVLEFYMKDLYTQQKIEPVRVKVAQRLSPEQQETIKEKMKAKTGAADIKLVQEISTELVAGFVLEWAFTDPDMMTCPTEGLDLSLKNVVKRAATKEGVPVMA